MLTVPGRTHAILLLKEDPKVDAGQDSDTPDAYRDALLPFFDITKAEEEECHQSGQSAQQQQQQQQKQQPRIDYLAPLALTYPSETALHFAMRQRPEASNVWALAFTSKNGVKAFEHCMEAALCTPSSSSSSHVSQTLPPPPPLDAWLSLPVFCLSGNTLKAVERVGFKTVYGRDFETLDQEGRPLAKMTSSSLSSSLSSNNDHNPTVPPILGNASQLADSILSLPWPVCHPASIHSSLSSSETTPPPPPQLSSSSVLPPTPLDQQQCQPELWFLTGETRMSTLHDRFQQSHRALREIEVYRTDPQPRLEDKIAAWLTKQIASCGSSSSRSSSRGSSSNSSASPAPPAPTLSSPLPPYTPTEAPHPESPPSYCTPSPAIIWLVGFSPKGVDLVWPGLRHALAANRSSSSSHDHKDGARPPSSPRVVIRWAAIGQTTASQIQIRLKENEIELDDKGGQDVVLASTVAFAAVPKPEHLAKAMQTTPISPSNH
ncbi:hypothetical protein DFQ26_002297 [Actinomortierella ambigua]|nr:hypothetical protein DFQ26_002297 [Actinomortierella ambigua]